MFWALVFQKTFPNLHEHFVHCLYQMNNAITQHICKNNNLNLQENEERARQNLDFWKLLRYYFKEKHSK